MTSRALVLVAALVAVPAAAANAQDEWFSEVQAQLDSDAEELYDLFGLEAAGEPVFGSLGAGQYATHQLNLNRRTDYMIVGACDRDCTDLDLELFDGQSRSLASDTGENDTPVVEPGELSGVYHVRVTMVTCREAPCRYGVQAFAAPAAAPPTAPPAPPAPAADTWADQVQAQLDAVAAEMSKRGFRAKPPSAGALKQTQSGTFESVELDAGRNHLILAACDRDCTDLDLRVFDAGGTLIDSDLKPDDAPVVEFIAPITGPFRLVVTMVACNAGASKPDGCRYGVQVYEQ